MDTKLREQIMILLYRAYTVENTAEELNIGIEIIEKLLIDEKDDINNSILANLPKEYHYKLTDDVKLNITIMGQYMVKNQCSDEVIETQMRLTTLKLLRDAPTDSFNKTKAYTLKALLDYFKGSE